MSVFVSYTSVCVITWKLKLTMTFNPKRMVFTQENLFKNYFQVNVFVDPQVNRSVFKSYYKFMSGCKTKANLKIR